MGIVKSCLNALVANINVWQKHGRSLQNGKTFRMIFHTLVCVMPLVLGLVQQSLAQDVNGYGMSTPGKFSVSPSGAASYRIPIQAPPGVAGMAPKLELVYSSQRGNGMLGLGWGISGLSSITRCARTKGQDGSIGAVSFDVNDRFCLDGQRLMLFAGTYGSPGSEYRTEIDSFSKIIANGTVGSGPSSFTVKTKSGLTIEYGNTSDSRIEALKSPSSSAAWATGSVRAWAQNKVTDLSGNFMSVTYDEDAVNGAYYPSRVDYTGNANSAPVLATTASVQFITDTSRLDAILGYQAGAQFKSVKRISAVRTYVGSTLTREYRLAYGAQSTALDRSKLFSVTECDGANNCLAPIALAWGSNGVDAFVSGFGKYEGSLALYLNAQNIFSTAENWTNNLTYPRFMVDVNGDGLPDIVGFTSNGVYVTTNTSGDYWTSNLWLSGQFGTAQGWTDNNTFPRLLADVNGDGLPDIVGFSGSGVYVAINNGSGFNAPSIWLSGQFGASQGWTNNSVYPRFMLDVNGDGLPDIVGFASNGAYVAINNGNGFNTPTYWLSGQFGTSQGWSDNSTSPRFLADVNGDGLPDIVGFASNGVFVAINNGNGFNTPTYWLSSQYGTSQGWSDNSTYPRFLADVNGDGLPDIVGFGSTGVMVSINTGAGFVAPVSWLPSQFLVSQGWKDSNVNPRQLVDVNGDGLPDIVGFGPSGVMVSLNNGSGFNSPVSWSSNFGSATADWADNTNKPRFVVDVNGDGLPDIVGFSGTGVTVQTDSRNVTSNFVASITNSTGASTTPTFSTLTQKLPRSIYAKDSGTSVASFPKVDVAAPFYVVDSVVSSNGIGGTNTTTYSYGGLKAEQGTGRGMLGFRWIASREPSPISTSLIERYNEYRQDWPYLGMPSLSETRLVSNGAISLLKQNKISSLCSAPNGATCTVAPLGIYFPYVSMSVEAAWDLNAVALPVTTTSFGYGQSPQFGDPTSITVGTDDGFSSTTANTYFAADTVNWITPRLQKATLTNIKP